MFNEDDYFKVLGRISVKFATLDLLVTELILKIKECRITAELHFPTLSPTEQSEKAVSV